MTASRGVQVPRLTGPERERTLADLKARYAAGASIRQLAADTGRSYTTIHHYLIEAGTVFRPRGGADRPRKGTT